MVGYIDKNGTICYNRGRISNQNELICTLNGGGKGAVRHDAPLFDMSINLFSDLHPLTCIYFRMIQVENKVWVIPIKEIQE